MERCPAVDTPEHTPPERFRTDASLDIFSLMFESYIGGDLLNAGLSPASLAVVKGLSASVGEKWGILREAWPRARQTTYGRVITLALRRFFGEDDFADGGAERATDRLLGQNTPGIYRRILQDECGFKAVLTQRTGFLEEGESDLFTLGVRPPGLGCVDRSVAQGEEERLGRRLNTLGDFLDSIRALLAEHARRGTVAFKAAAWNMGPPEPGAYEMAATLYGFQAFPPLKQPAVSEAEAAYGRVRNSPLARISPEDHWLLCGAVMHFLADVAKELDMVMVIHTGAAWESWIDFRMYRPVHLIPLLAAHPETRFDICHAGLPWPRELAMIAKVFPNTWIDLTWAHIISPEMTVSFLDELLDMVPPNKVVGFGGDYAMCVENVYGHLQIARENIARVLTRRIERGSLSTDEAIEIARSWLYENPVKLYRLSLSH